MTPSLTILKSFTKANTKGGLTIKLSIFAILLLTFGMLLIAYSGQIVAAESGSITGNVYCDRDKNGICDCEEGGIKDVHIQIFTEHCGGTALQTVSTDEKGNFFFESFDPGTYYVLVDLKYVCGGRVPTTINCKQVKLAEGETVNIPAFGYSEYGQ
jgi:hypothetical protein